MARARLKQKKKQQSPPQPTQAICVHELRRNGYPLVERGWLLPLDSEPVRSCPGHFMAVLPLEEVK
jgi:hypothetical protein